MTAQDESCLSVAIVGAGFGGIGMAVALREAGVESFAVFEKAAGPGGTWWVNRYPGCACDVQSHLYSFSFAPNPNWSRAFSSQPEIATYLADICEQYELAPHLHYGRDVSALNFDDKRQCWRVSFRDGQTVLARVVVGAFGALSRPALPQIEGLDQFDGPVRHSQQWGPDLELDGKRVAVIGTGASAIQFVPQIAPNVARLSLFQRTPPWILPKPDHAVGPRWQALYRRWPMTQKLARAALYLHLESRAFAFFRYPAFLKLFQKLAERHLRKQVADPALRAKLTPDYTLGCKRILISNDYYPALTRDNVDLVTEAVSRVEADGVRTASGELHKADVLILGTGFLVTEPFARGFITGANGQDLATTWQDGAEAYLGTAVAGFPNLFLLAGPNTALGHSSMVYMLESQIRYVRQAICVALAEQQALQVREDVQRKYNKTLQEKLAGTVWQTGGCRSWYQDANGKNVALWPGFTFAFRRRLAHFQPADYVSTK